MPVEWNTVSYLFIFYLLELSLSLATEKEENKLLQEQLSTMEVVILLKDLQDVIFE